MKDNIAGIDSAGVWSPSQFVIDMGWDYCCIEATAKHGPSDTDADGLTDQQQKLLQSWCKAKIAGEL